MAKIFVDVKTPGNGKIYEFQLDRNMNVSHAKQRIVSDISEFENNNITLKFDKVILSDLSIKKQLSESVSLYEAGVKSGHTLLLL